MFRTIYILIVVIVVSQCVVLNVTPTNIETRATVTVSWDDVDMPTPLDYIGLYLENYSMVLSKKYVTGVNTWMNGTGSVSMSLLNLRHRYYFAYVSGITNTTIGTSNFVNVSANVPMQGHIAITNNPSEMIVQWVSNNTLTPTVLYGFNSTSLTLNATGNFTTYFRTDMCGNRSTAYQNYIFPGLIHTVLLQNLRPGTTYFYRFGAGNNWSEIRSFRSRSITKNSPFRAIIYGDLGVGDGKGLTGTISPPVTQTVNSIKKDVSSSQYDMVLHIGDISYAQGIPWIWDLFFEQMQPIATTVPYMAAIGNHEYDYIGQPFKPNWSNYGQDSWGECGIPHLSRFAMPNNGLWYSMDYPHVHIVVMSSEHNFTVNSPQYQWLENDLKSVNHHHKWIIFAGHRPIYSSTVWGTEANVIEHMRQILEPLLMKYQVDLALWGHMHSYERTCPMNNYTCVGDLESPEGPVHMIIGSAGAWGFSNKYKNDFTESWKAAYGYIRLNIENRGSMEIEFQQTSGKWSVTDNVTLYYPAWDPNDDFATATTGSSTTTSTTTTTTSGSTTTSSTSTTGEAETTDSSTTGEYDPNKTVYPDTELVTEKKKSYSLVEILVPSVVGVAVLAIGALAFVLYKRAHRKEDISSPMNVPIDI